MKKSAVLLSILFSLPAFAGNSLQCKMSSVYKGDGMSSRSSLDSSKLVLGKSEAVPASLTGNCPAVIGYPASDEVAYVFYFAKSQKQDDGSTTCSYTEVSSGYTVTNLSCIVK